MEDTMTPLERKKALKNGQVFDRLPIVLFDNIVACRLIDMPYGVSESKAEYIAQKLIASYRRFGHDAVSVVYGVQGLGANLGTQLKYDAHAPASITSYALKDLGELDQLDWECASFEQDPLQGILYEAVNILADQIGNEVETRFHICCPFTAAAGVAEPELILRQTRKHPDKVHALLARTTQCMKQVVDQFAKIGPLYFSMSDPVASGSLVSPKHYEEFCLPYTLELTKHIKQYHKEVSMHICGNTSKMWQAINSLPIDSFSMDQVVDLAQAQKVMGQHCTLLGNVPPVEVLLQGTPSQVTEAVRVCFEKAIDSPNGFQIAPGCDVPLMTPFENLDAYMAAGRYFGQWPLVKERCQL